MCAPVFPKHFAVSCCLPGMSVTALTVAVLRLTIAERAPHCGVQHSQVFAEAHSRAWNNKRITSHGNDFREMKTSSINKRRQTGCVVFQPEQAFPA